MTIPPPSILRSCPTRRRLFYAKQGYWTLFYNTQTFRETYSFDALSVIRTGAGRPYTVITSAGSREEIDAAFIENVISAETDSNRTIDKYLSGQSTAPEFGMTSVADGTSWYVGYVPLSDGYALCILSNLEQFGSALSRQQLRSILYSIISFAIVVAVLSWFIYQKTAKPIAKMQKIVRNYTEDKDTERIVTELQGIRVGNEIGILAGDISTLAVEMKRHTDENVRLAAEKQRVSTELDLAANIQKNALPVVTAGFLEGKNLDLSTFMKPAKEVGGDFYDFFMLDDDHLALVIADVSGKGVPAAMFMMMSKIHIHNYANMGLSPAEVLMKANNAIAQTNKAGMFVTVWFGILEISTGKLRAANAGHEYPVLRQPGGQYELLKDKHGFVLGGLPNIKYTEYELELRPGGTLFVYTDGVPEATNAAQEMFGPDRMLEAMNALDDDSTDALIDTVHRAAVCFERDEPQFDDMTMLAVRRT